MQVSGDESSVALYVACTRDCVTTARHRIERLGALVLGVSRMQYIKRTKRHQQRADSHMCTAVKSEQNRSEHTLCTVVCTSRRCRTICYYTLHYTLALQRNVLGG